MKAIKTLVLLLIFVAGMFTASLITYAGEKGLQDIPDSSDFLTGKITGVPTPGDWISEDDIQVLKDRIIIFVDNPEWARFADTESMKPTLDQGHNAIQIKPQDPKQINVGDIISYNPEHGSGSIIHRVVAKGFDEEGYYFYVKGDNNDRIDPQKVRFDDIERLTIGVLF